MLFNEQFWFNIVVDLPNIIFRKRGVCTRTFLVFIDFIRKNRQNNYFIPITPKMRETAPFIVKIIETMERKEKNIFTFYTEKKEDPDMAILEMSKTVGGFILSNDRYKQEKYANFNKQRQRVVKYKISRNQLLIIP